MDYLNDVNAYEAEWASNMVLIWREKVERLAIIRTGTLHQSFDASISHSGQGSTISLTFALYGIYQALGVGNRYEHGNGGYLRFLDTTYRKEHGLDKPRKVGPAWGDYITSGHPRKARDWYTRKLSMSIRAIEEDLARICGDNAATIICNELNNIRNATR